MRLTFFTAAAALALAGCGKPEAEGAGNRSEEVITAEDFAGNDVTAIDAASGSDANMAAEVDINLVANDDDEDSGRSPSRRPAARDKAPGNASGPASEPTPEPAAPADNAAANSN